MYKRQGYTYVSTSSQLAWLRTVSLGTYWYCCGGVLVYTYSSTACTVNSLRSNKFHQFIISLLQVIRDIRMYIPPHSSPGGVPFPWVRTGTAAAVYSYIRTAVLPVVLTRFAGMNFIAASDTGYTYVCTSSQLAWWRTVSLGTYWYCCSGVLVYSDVPHRSPSYA